MLRYCLALALPLVVVAVPAESKHSKFQHETTERLRRDHAQLRLMKVKWEAEPGYLLAEDAYTHAIDDLEDFGHDPSITEERLSNDLQELEFDLHEIDSNLIPAVDQ